MDYGLITIKFILGMVCLIFHAVCKIKLEK